MQSTGVHGTRYSLVPGSQLKYHGMMYDLASSSTSEAANANTHPPMLGGSGGGSFCSGRRPLTLAGWTRAMSNPDMDTHVPILLVQSTKPRGSVDGLTPRAVQGNTDNTVRPNQPCNRAAVEEDGGYAEMLGSWSLARRAESGNRSKDDGMDSGEGRGAIQHVLPLVTGVDHCETGPGHDGLQATG